MQYVLSPLPYMHPSGEIEPKDGELPHVYSDRLGIYYTRQVTLAKKKENGQFFTPIAIGRLMSSLVETTENTVRILDPGCGAGVLSCMLVEGLIANHPTVRNIELIAYETDENLGGYLAQCFDYLRIWSGNHGIELTYKIYMRDFIMDAARWLTEMTSEDRGFDMVISNPPFFKLPKDDPRAVAVRHIIGAQSNIYSIFMSLSALLLKKQGQMVFIVPRSFASGQYFQRFRELFFTNVQLERAHLFDSRTDTFSRDKVLQETVVLKAVRMQVLPNCPVTISSSIGLKDISSPTMRRFSTHELIDLSSEEKILHLPIRDSEVRILKLVSEWSNTLGDMRIQISTGPVVAFRSRKQIQMNYKNGTITLVPLFWLQNVHKMTLTWPLALKDKGQYITLEPDSLSLLIPNKNYILLRRFSTKDDKSRLIAAPYFCNAVKATHIGVENKVNYIYRTDGIMDRVETVGLSALLNSWLFNDYFQMFNGNVNVSATELRAMKFPPLTAIREIGETIILVNDYSMEVVNKTVNNYFDTTTLLIN